MRVQRLLRVVGIFRLLRVDRLAPLRKRRSDYVEITTKNEQREKWWDGLHKRGFLWWEKDEDIWENDVNMETIWNIYRL